VLDKNEIFVPIGWDSLAKIRIDFDNQKICSDPEKPFEEVIKAPAIKRAEEKSLITAETEQAFLLRHSTISPATPSKESNTPPSSSFSSSPTSPVASSVPVTPVTSTKTKPKSSLENSPTVAPTTPTLANDTDHEKLAIFFNSLIQKKKTPKKGNK